MFEIRINRNLLRIVHGHDDNIEAYRFYVIARHAFSNQSGLFSLDELCDVLHHSYDYSSLYRGRGSQRSGYRRRFKAMFTDSIFFQSLTDGRFKINSERKILKKIYNSDKSSWYQIPNKEILASKGKFRDFSIGVLLNGNKFRSNTNIANYCSISKRRIQLATASNHKKDYFTKQYNIIDDCSGTKQQVTRLRAELYNIHGITTPKPFRRQRQTVVVEKKPHVKVTEQVLAEWVLRVQAPNSYTSYTILSGVKGFNTQALAKSKHKKERHCWFVPIRENNKQLNLFKNEKKRWAFNDKVYNINTYVQDNSRYLNV